MVLRVYAALEEPGTWSKGVSPMVCGLFQGPRLKTQDEEDKAGKNAGQAAW